MDLLVLIHALTGAIWFGGHVYVEGLMAAAVRAGDPEAVATIGVRVAKTNGRIFMTAGFVTLITGFTIVLTSDWEFETFFIALGFGITLGLLIFAVLVLKPREDRLEHMAAERGFTDPELLEELRKTGNLGRIMTLGVSIVIVLMLAKPFL